MSRPLRVLLAAALAAAAVPARADVIPPSGLRVDVLRAAVTELDCRRRPFKMENTKSAAGGFSRMARGFTEDPDPRTVLLAAAGVVLLIPVTVVAAPVDLLAGPFRRECSYEVRLEGALVGWAGQAAPNAAISLEARNLLSGGREGGPPPEWFVSTAEAVTDADGRFAVTFGGHSGRHKNLDILWTVDGKPGSSHRLLKRGKRFVFSELDPGFGVGIHEMEPIEIRPVLKKPD